MPDEPPVPPPATTLWYAHGGLLRSRLHRFLRRLTAGQAIAIVLLAVLALVALWVIGSSIPHPYAGWGIDVFLVTATAAFFLVRRRAIVIGALAVVIGGAVVGLHLRAKRYLTIRNDSAAVVSKLDVMLNQGRQSMELAVDGIPPRSQAEVSVLFPGYDGGEVWVSGLLADDTVISYSTMDRAFGRGPVEPYHHKTLVVIHPDGAVTVTNP